jgi:hypothetical protein
MLHGDVTAATTTTAGQASRIVPVGDLQSGGTPVGVPPAHPEAVIRGQVNPAAKNCYDSDPDSKSKRSGRLVILLKVAPSGEVDSVSVANDTGLSPSVTSCITTAARAVRFAPPGAHGTTVRAAFAFPGQEQQSGPAVPPAKSAKSGQAVSVPAQTGGDKRAQGGH